MMKPRTTPTEKKERSAIRYMTPIRLWSVDIIHSAIAQRYCPGPCVETGLAGRLHSFCRPYPCSLRYRVSVTWR